MIDDFDDPIGRDELREELHAADALAAERVARIAELEAEIITLSRALIDYENWIEQALREPMLSMPRPASFGQWRRVEKA